MYEAKVDSGKFRRFLFKKRAIKWVEKHSSGVIYKNNRRIFTAEVVDGRLMETHIYYL